MSSRRRVVLGLMAWTLVVAAVSGVAWVAIDRAGRQVLEPASLPRDAAAAGAPTATPEPAARPGTPSPATKEPTRSRGPSKSGPAVSTRPQSSRSAEPARTPSTRAPSPTPARTRTVTVAGGRLAVSCDGSRVRLLYATPEDGWQVEVGDNGPEKVEVHFRQRSGGDGENEVSVRCVAGTPRVQSGEGGRSDDG